VDASRGLSLAAIIALVAVLAGCGGTKTVTVTTTQTVTTTAAATTTAELAACTTDDLTGVFKELAGSAGAGQISYELVLTNATQSPCWVSGLPTIQLLDASGGNLPTHEDAAHPGTATAAKITLQPGDSASAQARFSPDVNGVGDNQTGACQPKAATARVVIGAGTLDAPIQPPTSVCEQGALHVDLFTAAS